MSCVFPGSGSVHIRSAPREDARHHGVTSARSRRGTRPIQHHHRQGLSRITRRDYAHQETARGELDEHDRAINHDINSLRAAVELANAHIKNWKILHTDYRRPLKTFTTTLNAARGLIFFAMDFE